MHILYIMSFIFGAVTGSFLNVCIYRLPRGESVISPPSHCPACGYSVRFFDNIPIISYLILRGRCRNCGNAISIQYPAVELLTAFLSLILFYKYGASAQYLASFIFTASLIVIAFIDLAHQIIPDIITLPGIPIFLAAGVLVMEVPLKDALIGILAGGGILYIIAFGYELITKREGMGGGDIKLLAMLGGYLGWQSILFILFVSSILGAVIGISIAIYNRGDMRYAIPYGPFLSLAAVLYLFCRNYFFRLVLLR